jgi:zinc D-Ala-D-Ala carboxypeptidase
VFEQTDEEGARVGGKRIRSATLAVSIAVLEMIVAAQAGVAAEIPTLRPGDTGRAVKRLQVRVAGWFPDSRHQVHFALDGVYGPQTVAAVKALQSHYGIRATGVAGRATRRVLRRLRDRNGSTAHFDYAEFTQNFNRACSARANAYARTFGGGLVGARRARRNVRRLMWRLEAVRAKGGGMPIGINSGFRSVAYNDCIGGARASQHMYGTAADNRMANVSNRRERRVAKFSQVHGIGCYASQTHNHFDIRIDNPHAPATRSWWWPDRDRRGRDLDAGGRPCWGQRRGRGRSALDSSARVAAAPVVPTPADVRAFASAGEPRDLAGAD